MDVLFARYWSATDPMTEIDIPHFVKQTGQRLMDYERQGELYVFRIARQH